MTFKSVYHFTQQNQISSNASVHAHTDTSQITIRTDIFHANMQESLIRHDFAQYSAALSHPHICQWLLRYCVVDQSSRTTDTALWRAYQETRSLGKTDSTRVPLVFRRAIFITFSMARLAYNTGFGDVERSVIVGIRHPGSAFGFNPLRLPSTVEIQYHVPDTGIWPSLLREIFKYRIPDELSIDLETRLTAATIREQKTGSLFRSCLQEEEEDHDDLVRLVEGAAASFAVYTPVNLAPRLRDVYLRRTRNHYRNALFTRLYALQELQDARESTELSLNARNAAEAKFKGAHKRVEAMRLSNEANNLAHVPPFRLMNLPFEHRLMIYEFALAASRPIDVVVATKDVSLTYTPPPGLTLVSRSVRAECLPVYYANNHFVLHLCADRYTHGIAANGFENQIIFTWMHKIGDLYRNGQKIADGLITRRMRALSVVFQARVVHLSRALLPAAYRTMRFDLTYSHVSGLSYAIPSNYAHKWLGGIRRLEEVLANTKSMERPGLDGGTRLFAYFLFHDRLLNDWELGIGADGTRIASGALLAANCDCHTRLS
ncbi:hypothetical protein EJ03DRAFT_1910 [Teratosphaeria nubilosa]|uniref:F-box domain-containing protein n=1 Tax=Teratosphaeria nubilosa TaxID=161662 RepID=A0A6G1LN02_9PEZI|nr:hypothetical protein EJ03DRAFT_1910 [Teratosphaeria nubilosa]